MKRNLFKTVIVIFNIVLLTVLLCFYVNSDIVAMNVCIIIIIGVDVIALCIFLNSLFEIEIEYCHKHLSDWYTTEVIPLKMKDVKMGLTIEEAAEMSGIGRNTMRKLVDWGKLPVLKVGRKTIIRRDTLENFMTVNQGRNLLNQADVREVH